MLTNMSLFQNLSFHFFARFPALFYTFFPLN
jgi:hypothetical protein